jgi:hypothetical protein
MINGDWVGTDTDHRVTIARPAPGQDGANVNGSKDADSQE